MTARPQMPGPSVGKHPTIARAVGEVAGVVSRLPAGSHILLGCSGGADSVAAMGLLARLRARYGMRVSLGHVDHGLRPESAAEGRLVAEHAGRHAMSFASRRIHLDPGAGLPARARAARLGALRDMARELEAQWIGLAHTATDQAETMLMNLSRGAGLRGMAGMSAIDAPWLRPLLGLTREQARDVAARLRLEFVDDPSNEDPRHPRVRMRTRVIPELRRLNPRAELAFARAASLAREDELALQQWAWDEATRRRRTATSWDVLDCDRLPRGVRMRFVRCICELGGVDVTELRATVVGQIAESMCVRATAPKSPKTADVRPFPPPRGVRTPQGTGSDAAGVGLTPRRLGGRKSWRVRPNRRIEIADAVVSIEAVDREPGNH